MEKKCILRYASKALVFLEITRRVVSVVSWSPNEAARTGGKISAIFSHYILVSFYTNSDSSARLFPSPSREVFFLVIA